MSRRLGLAVVVAAIALAGPAAAQPAVSADGESRDDAVEQMVAGHLGLRVGGGATPGGLALGGDYLYRLSERDWLDAFVGFGFGGGGAECFRDRADEVVCDHGALDGFAGEAGAAIRRHFAGQGSMVPFARLGLAVGIVSFADDDVKGLAVPLIVGGGIRARVAPHVQVVGSGDLRVGLARLGGRVGTEPQLGLAVMAGVEFELH